MKCYVNKQKKLILAPDYNDRYGGISNTTIQLRTGKLTEAIEQEVGEAILDIIKKYEPIFDTPIIDDLFREKEQAIRKMVDYDTVLTEMVEGLEIEDY